MIKMLMSSTTNDIANCFGIGGVIIALVGVVFTILAYFVARKGVSLVEQLKELQQKTQMAANYGFYMNLQIYLEIIQKFVGNSDWLRILGESINDKSEQFRKKAQECSNVAKNFLMFLAQAQNQIPPQNCEREEWYANFKKLRVYLFHMAYYDLAAYSEWNEEGSDSSYEDLCSIINYLIEAIGN